jgi:hypothetical protein
MRLALLLLGVSALGLGGMLAACGSTKHPPPATLYLDGGSSDTDSGSPATQDDAGEPRFCLDVHDASVAPRDCHCPFQHGMFSADLPCGVTFCEDADMLAAICDYDAKLTIVHGVPFSTCTAEAGPPPCTPESDAGAGADAGNAGADAGDGG